MNKLNSKTTRIVSALALSAGLFSVSNSAMAASCSIETDYPNAQCLTKTTVASTGSHKVTATATATDKITGRGVKGRLLLMNPKVFSALSLKAFVGSTKITYTSDIVGREYVARVDIASGEWRMKKLTASISVQKVSGGRPHL